MGEIAVLFATIILPLFVLLLTSVTEVWVGKLFFLDSSAKFTLDHWKRLFGMDIFYKSLFNSLFISTLGAFFGMLLSSLVSYYVVKVEHEDSEVIASTSGVLDQLSYVPAAVPGVVMAVGFIWFVLSVPSFGLYGSIWLLGLAYIAREIPYGSRTAHGAMSQVGDVLEEQARIAGAGWIRTIVDIILPVIKKNFAAGYILLFMIMMKNLSMSIFLYSEESIVLPVMIFNLKWTGQNEVLAALAIVMFVLILTIVGILTFLFDAELRKNKPVSFPFHARHKLLTTVLRPQSSSIE